MKRYAAFLRGVSPVNANMTKLRSGLTAAGFADVATVLASGNVVLATRPAADDVVARRIERAMREQLGYEFATIVRAIDDLDALIDADPFARFRLPANAKRVVTFLRAPASKTMKPPELDGARILAVREREVLTAYTPAANGGAPFMVLIEKTFGKQVTTRTWETVKKVAARGRAAE